MIRSSLRRILVSSSSVHANASLPSSLPLASSSAMLRSLAPTAAGGRQKGRKGPPTGSLIALLQRRRNVPGSMVHRIDAHGGSRAHRGANKANSCVSIDVRAGRLSKARKEERGGEQEEFLTSTFFFLGGGREGHTAEPTCAWVAKQAHCRQLQEGRSRQLQRSRATY